MLCCFFVDFQSLDGSTPSLLFNKPNNFIAQYSSLVMKTSCSLSVSFINSLNDIRSHPVRLFWMFYSSTTHCCMTIDNIHEKAAPSA